MSERTFTAADMKANAASLKALCYCDGDRDTPCGYCDNAAMLRQGAEAVEAQRELRALIDTWPQHRETSAKYASVDEVQSLLAEKDTEIARLKNDLKNREIASTLNFDTYVSDIEKRDDEIARLREAATALVCALDACNYNGVQLQAVKDALGLTGELAAERQRPSVLVSVSHDSSAAWGIVYDNE